MSDQPRNHLAWAIGAFAGFVLAILNAAWCYDTGNRDVGLVSSIVALPFLPVASSATLAWIRRHL